jgi:DNA-binding response OmpR family regulator
VLVQGAAATSEQFLEKVWDENVDGFTNVLRVTVMNLCRKLGDPPLIATVAGIGHQL